MKPQLIIAGAGFLGCEIARQAAAYDIITLTKSGDDSHLACDISSLDEVSALAQKYPNPATCLLYTSPSPRD